MMRTFITRLLFTIVASAPIAAHAAITCSDNSQCNPYLDPMDHSKGQVLGETCVQGFCECTSPDIAATFPNVKCREALQSIAPCRCKNASEQATCNSTGCTCATSGFQPTL